MLDRLKAFIQPPPPLVTPHANQYLQVFSHPRSGTHFLEKFIGDNFYQNVDLGTGEVIWGHWSDRRANKEGNPYGKLFGSHAYPQRHLRKIDYPVVYIARDGRAVAYSIWKTQNFLHPKHKDISFSEFLRLKLDWIGSPAFQCRPKFNIAQHWYRHVKGWHKLSKDNPNICFIRYEELVDDPYKVYLSIYDKFFTNQTQLGADQISIVSKPTGLLPNQAKPNSWKEKFTKQDVSFFDSQLGSSEYLTK